MKKQFSLLFFSAALLFGSACADAAGSSQLNIKSMMEKYKVERKMVTVGGLADPHSVEFQRGNTFFVLQMLPDTASELEQYEGARAFVVYQGNQLISYKIKKN